MSWKWLVVGVQLIILKTTTPGSLRLSWTNSLSTGTAWSTNVGMMSRWVTTTTPLGPPAIAEPAVTPANSTARSIPRSIDMVALLSLVPKSWDGYCRRTPSRSSRGAPRIGWAWETNVVHVEDAL